MGSSNDSSSSSAKTSSHEKDEGVEVELERCIHKWNFSANVVVNLLDPTKSQKTDSVNIDISGADPCGDHHLGHEHGHGHGHGHHMHSLDLVTTLRSELAATSYKRDRLANELTDAKSALCAKETECESLRSQAARQSTLIGSLQNRLQALEQRERNLQQKCDTTIHTLRRDKTCLEERNKELSQRVHRLESEVAAEESQKEHATEHYNELIRKLSVCLGIDVCDTSHLSGEGVLSRTGELVAELQKLRTKIAATCETLTSCEGELMNLKSISSVDKQRMSTQIEVLQNHNSELEARCRQHEKDLQIARDRLAESEINADKMREELRGFESRCHRLQNTIDRFQTDRIQFLRSMASILCVPEPCETLIKDKVREIVSENQTTHTQLHTIREQMSSEAQRHREQEEAANCRLRSEETQKTELEERLEKTQTELEELRSDHINLSEYLVRLARALCWSECTSPPAPGTDTVILAESLIERAERLSAHHEHHAHCEKESWDHHHHHHHSPVKLRRERSCHDIPVKESSAMYSLQRKVRVLREQLQRRDLHLELLRRKVALLEDGIRGRTILQTEREDALGRLRRASKQTDKLSHQLVDAKAQLQELKVQLAEAAEHKIAALERARKIDELNAKICELEADKTHLQSQVNSFKDRARSAVETSQERHCRDESLIHSLRDEIARLKSQLIDANHRLSHLQTFKTSVARTLHLRDIPESDLLHRLQTLCNAHQEFTMLSRRYESASPIGDHGCTRYDDPHCRPISASPKHRHHYNSRRYVDEGGGGGGGVGGGRYNDDHDDNDYNKDYHKDYSKDYNKDYNKKY